VSPHSRDGKSPELCLVRVPRMKRAQGMPGAGRTHGPPATRKAGGSHHRFSRNNRHSLRNGLRLIARSPRSTGLASLRRPANVSQDLIPASGDQDHTPSPSASTHIVCAPSRPSHPASRFVTIGRNVPLHEAGRAQDFTFSDFQKEKYFAPRP